MHTVNAIHQQFLARAQGTPYTVSPIPGGLELHLNVADMRWASVMHRNGLRMAYSIRVHLDPERQMYTREQVVRTMSWSAGAGGVMVPTISAEAEVNVERGTVIRLRRTAVLGAHDNGRIVDGFTFDSREMADVVHEVMAPLGWRRRLDTHTRIGAAFAIGAGLFVVGILVWLLVADV
ncbi:hypothetical protein [Nocardiopsis valliformis]|uniref:hypothetical protein n=1 Tax=Nocardiopsis valliformis TaxID=239974 RepID=UPI000346D4AB|nr:hypothetical protein [Nocardiopsis valliformis]